MDRKLKVFFLLGPCFPVNLPSSLTPGYPENVSVCSVLPPPLGRWIPAHGQSILPPAAVSMALRAHLQLSRAEGERSRVLSASLYWREGDLHQEWCPGHEPPLGNRGHSMRLTHSSGICSSNIYLTLCARTVLGTDFVPFEQSKEKKLELWERVEEGRATVTSFSELKLEV